MNKVTLTRLIYILTIVVCIGVTVGIVSCSKNPDPTPTATSTPTYTPEGTATTTPTTSPTNPAIATPTATPTSPPTATPTPTPIVCQESIRRFTLPATSNGTDKDLVFAVEEQQVTLTVSYLTSRNLLAAARPSVDAGNGTVSFSSSSVNADGTVNLTQDCVCTVTDKQGVSREYKVNIVYIKLDLPIVYLTTDSGLPITSKTQYVNGTFALDCADSYMSQFQGFNPKAIQIRGRGQSSWEQYDKKSYKIKFVSKTEILGMAPNKKWVMIANHSDKTLMQNYLAMDMATVLDNLAFTTHQYPVDVFFNGEYAGVYTIGEQIEVKKGRVDIEPEEGDDSLAFLIELGGRDDDAVDPPKYYTVGYLRNFVIHYPEEEVITTEQVNAIKAYLRQCDNAVKFLQDYEEFIDVDSLVDWVITYEMTYNLDGCMRRSCYMTLSPEGKLQMGPIWDFDLAFGNFHRYAYGTWATIGSADEDTYVKLNWINCLAADEEFINKLRSRWAEIKYDLLDRMISEVDAMEIRMTPSALHNFEVWDVIDTRLFGQPYSTVNYKTYDAHVERLRDYINSRWQWLDSQDWNLPLTDF